jgi:hypothetical protein
MKGEQFDKRYMRRGKSHYLKVDEITALRFYGDTKR